MSFSRTPFLRGAVRPQPSSFLMMTDCQTSSYRRRSCLPSSDGAVSVVSTATVATAVAVVSTPHSWSPLLSLHVAVTLRCMRQLHAVRRLSMQLSSSRHCCRRLCGLDSVALPSLLQCGHFVPLIAAFYLPVLSLAGGAPQLPPHLNSRGPTRPILPRHWVSCT